MSVEATAIAAPALPKFDVVFLDMDGVLADFQGAACKVHNKLPVADLIRLKYWQPQEWLMWTVFGITVSKFWQVIDETPQFWHDMPKTSFCDGIIGIANGLSDTVRILSTPHKTEACYAGKKYWCWKNTPGYKITLNEDDEGRSSKELLARPGRLLLDDSDKNVNAFRAAGGSAILIPQHWNSAHAAAPYGVLFYLAQELEKLRMVQENDASWARSDQPAGVIASISYDSETRKLSYDQRPAEPAWPIHSQTGTWNSTPPEGYGPGTNTGHGHAWQRPDGEYAKCFGVRKCPECSRDFKYFYGDDAEIVKANNPTMDEAVIEINTAIAKQIGEQIKRSLENSPDVLRGDGVQNPPLGTLTPLELDYLSLSGTNKTPRQPVITNTDDC